MTERRCEAFTTRNGERCKNMTRGSLCPQHEHLRELATVKRKRDLRAAHHVELLALLARIADIHAGRIVYPLDRVLEHEAPPIIARGRELLP